MMKWEELFARARYLNETLTTEFQNMWKQLEMELESLFGPANKDQTESGSDSIKKFSMKNGQNILIKHTSEPNTITIHMTLDPPSSNETTSNTMNPDSSPPKEDTGISKANA